MAITGILSATSPNDKVVVLEAGRPDARYWQDLWESREIMYVLARRDFLVRYKQTVIGVLWAVVRPAMNVLIFTLVFGVVARLPSQEGVPYPVLVLSGLMPWMLFSSLLSEMSGSMLNNGHMIAKIYFPRLLVPMSTIPVNLIDFAISCVLMVALMLFYGFVPSWQIVFLPLLMLWTVIVATGAGLIFASLNVSYRDVRYVVPFALSIGWLLSPIGYTLAIVPDYLRFFFTLNPLVALIESFRWSILGQGAPLDWPPVAISIAICVVLLYGGVKYFKRSERAFADVI
jgi:lipopolysaccharide transport system permease protein